MANDCAREEEKTKCDAIGICNRVMRDQSSEARNFCFLPHIPIRHSDTSNQR